MHFGRLSVQFVTKDDRVCANLLPTSPETYESLRKLLLRFARTR
jgi:hypothetical protein